MNVVAGDELAELLTLLGGDVAQAVLPHLGPESAAMLSRRAADGRAISPKRRERLLGEFERFLQFVMTQNPGRPTAEANDEEQDEEPPMPDSVGEDPLEVLRCAPVRRISMALRDEHPRVSAVALDCLPAERTAELLAGLSAEVRPEVVKQLGQGISVRNEVRNRLMRAVAQKVLSLPDEPVRDEDHLKRLAHVIRATEKSVRRPLIEALQEQDPDAASRLTDLLYRFEDLISMEDRSVQQILGQIDVSTLATAMSGSADEISDKVFRNLSRRAADMLKEELQFAGRASASKIEQARMAIVRLIAKTEMESEG
ncbi:MAG: hypothetical protein KF774_20010 [Planctomyces sp.]|nr:hypothetical protein [Planctomyces sp.]